MKYCPQCSQQYNNDSQRFCQADRHLLSLEDPYNLVGRTLGNKYLIEALVGLGGMGAVYAAQNVKIDRRVAFKILQPNFAIKNPGAKELFETEARTSGRLKHENIVEVFDADRIENISYIAMEWLEGHTLEDELAAQGQLGFERAAWILRQIAAALDAAHAKRTIHRDLKPSNVMLVKRPDGSERVKVLDFGIGKVLGTTTGPVEAKVSKAMGTPRYACPEQFTLGSKIDVRADIYSLGVVLFEMLTGKLPFTANSLGELIHLQLTAPPLPLRTLRQDAPTAVEELVMRMLAKNAADRPQRASEAVALFEAALKPNERYATTAEMREVLRIANEPESIPTTVKPPKQAATPMSQDQLLSPTEMKTEQPRGKRWKYLAASGGLVFTLSVVGIVSRYTTIIPESESTIKPPSSPEITPVRFLQQSTTEPIQSPTQNAALTNKVVPTEKTPIVRTTPEPTPIRRTNSTEKAPIVKPTLNATSALDSGNFTVKVASYSDPKEADDHLARLKSAGLSAHIVKRSRLMGMGGLHYSETRYEIQIGKFETQEQAVTYASQLRSKALIQDFVIITVNKSK